jgi:hypothetical protein
MNKAVIVCDLVDHFLGNKIFSEEIQKKFPWGESFWLILKEKCNQSEIDIVTSDVFLRQFDSEYYNYRSYLISSMTNGSTNLLLSKVNVALLIYSLESPNVAVRFYADIDNIALKYKYTLFFGGIANHLSNPNSHQILHWPNTFKAIIGTRTWEERDFLCFIASNKSKYDVLQGKPFKLVRIFLKRLYLFLLPFRFTFLRSVDLYDFRYKAINYFIEVNELKLFGMYWDKRKSLSKKLFDKISATNPQPVDNKIITLGKYRFALCFENCIYPGYLTEKIFDCFFAGTIPIYLGAPNVQELIPKESFIDFRDFNDFEKLYSFLKRIDKSTARNYHEAAAAFLKSREFMKFTDISMSERIFQLFQLELNK